VGPGARVEAESIEDSVVLPGAQVRVRGKIRHALLGGEVSAENDLDSVILHGDHAG
jgi:hypothetical protein